MIFFRDIKEIDIKLLDLMIKEYEYLKIEAKDAIIESRLIERNSIVASAVVWAWFFSQQASLPMLKYIKIIPFVVCLFGALRSFALHVRLRRISEYMERQENFFGNCCIISWETRLRKEPWILTTTSIVFWVVISSINWFAYMKA